jgi:hypothetical protein
MAAVDTTVGSTPTRCHANKRGRVELVNQDLAFKRAIARRPGAQQRPCDKPRALAAGLVIALLLVGGASRQACGSTAPSAFRWVCTSRGARGRKKGVLVFVNPPALPTTRRPVIETGQYNIQLCLALLSMSALLELEYNDNIALSETNRKSDLIVEPLLSTKVLWQVSEYNAMRLNLGVGYVK